MTEAGGGSLWPRLVFDLAIVVVSALFVRAGYYELFVDVPGVHTARWMVPWGTLKSALVLLTASAGVSCLAALLLVVVVRTPPAPTAVRTARIVEVVAFLTALASYCLWMLDFINNAGRFG